MGFEKSEKRIKKRRSVSPAPVRDRLYSALDQVRGMRKVKSCPKTKRPKQFKVMPQQVPVQMSDQAAATLIQKEVRKFLNNLGFYEARPRNEKHEEPVSLFIENTQSPEPKVYELVDMASSQKSSIKLQISPLKSMNSK